ncbi:MAG: hypothetical protein H6862_06160 [Rhodospirillales bacterium]|nr:hypothetical protein [Rhodospirillales bacterium]
MQDTDDIESIFSTLPAQDVDALIRLPFRVGVWISASDSTGGAESEADELRALETIIASYAEEYLKSEFVQKLLEKTFSGKDSWSLWAQNVGSVPVECARLTEILESYLPAREVSAFRENLMDIAVAVAMVFREEEDAGSRAPVPGFLERILRALGFSAKKSIHANISRSELKALRTLAKALKVRDPAPLFSG